MGKIQIITDSASDISKEAEQKYNLDVISYSVVIGDQTYTSRVDFDNEGCYKLMEENDGIPMTSQITAFQFMDLYYEYYQKGCTELVLILINGKGSATYNNLSLIHIQMCIRDRLTDEKLLDAIVAEYEKLAQFLYNITQPWDTREYNH